MRIAVCDDELIFVYSLAKRLKAVSSDVLTAEFSNASDLICAINSGRSFDALFLDIEMPVLNGLDAAKHLRENGCDIPIVFLTSHTEMAMEGYEVDALRFLPKYCTDRKLTEALKAIQRELGSKPNVVIRQKGEDIVISPDSIIYAEADNNTVRFILREQTLSTRMKLGEALEMLEKASDDFVRIHRCTIVNLRHVSKYTSKEIMLDNGETVPVSKSCAADFKTRMFEFVRSSAR